MGGQVDFMFDTTVVAGAHIQSGKLRALAVTSAKRLSDSLPDVPTVAESGWPGTAGFEVVSWQALFAPAGTPKPIVDKLHAEILKIIQSPEMQERIKGLGMQPSVLTPEQVQAFEAGCHVFIEKPLANTLAEAKEIVSLATEANVKAMVGHVERFNPALLSLDTKHMNPMFIEVHRLAEFNPRGTDVSVVLDLMIHDIDIVLSLVKSNIKNISASGVCVVSSTPDIANARIVFDNEYSHGAIVTGCRAPGSIKTVLSGEPYGPGDDDHAAPVPPLCPPPPHPVPVDPLPPGRRGGLGPGRAGHSPGPPVWLGHRVPPAGPLVLCAGAP